MTKQPKELLTEEGKRYARYIFIAHGLVQRIPWAGKYMMGFMVSVVYSIIVKEGAKEHARKRRQKRETKMSGVRDRVSSSRGEASAKMREVQLPIERISGLQKMVRGNESETKEANEER